MWAIYGVKPELSKGRIKKFGTKHRRIKRLKYRNHMQEGGGTSRMNLFICFLMCFPTFMLSVIKTHCCLCVTLSQTDSSFPSHTVHFKREKMDYDMKTDTCKHSSGSVQKIFGFNNELTRLVWCAGVNKHGATVTPGGCLLLLPVTQLYKLTVGTNLIFY